MRRQNIIVPALIFVGGLAGWFLNSAVSPNQTANLSDSFQEERVSDGYRFINPLLSCDIAENLLTHALRPFKANVANLIKTYTDSGKIQMAAVYFRDLNNGPWFGINEKEKFAPASLLKVPIMMAILKKADTDQRLLEKRITYHADGDENSAEHFPPAKAIQDGKSYTVEDLITYMVVYSDNNAKNLLLSTFDPDISSIIKVLTDLGISFPPDTKADNSFITVRDYASFFRVLFNASYLTKASSEKALGILAKTNFKIALDAQIPDSVTIAHKFGERELDDQSQLHDCGIIYYPGHPYLLCVMTRGQNVDTLTKVISDISKLVYSEVKAQAL